MLKTKCYRAASDDDGLKISVMRFTPKRFQYDLLMVELSPTPELLRSYRSGKVTWEQYEERFASLLEQNSESVDRLIQLASQQDVTIYCSEATPKKCHRRLVAEEVVRKSPELEVHIK